MPLTKSGSKMKASFTKRYGSKLGTQRFYMTANKQGIRHKVDPSAKKRGLTKYGRKVGKKR